MPVRTLYDWRLAGKGPCAVHIAPVSETERGQVDFTKVDTLRRYADAIGGTLRIEVEVGDETYLIA